MHLRLTGAFLTLIFLTSYTGCEDKANDDRPNILFILADDLGYADLSLHGSPDVKTPNIDALAKQSLQFTQAYVSAPQCSPSRAGIMTGRYQQRFGHEANPEVPFVESFGLDTKQKTMARFLADEGYKTCGFGKWDLGTIPSAQPWTRGFEYYFGHYAGARSFFVEPKEGMLGALRKSAKDPGGYKGYLTDLITDDAVKQLKRGNDGRPWFAYMSYLTPHWPMEVKPEDLAKYSHVKDLHRRIFLALMDNLDQNVGKLLDHLKDTGQDKNTVVVFLSDNGGPTGAQRTDPNAPPEYGKNTSLNAPYKGVKGEVFDGGIHTPWFVKWPEKIKPGTFDRSVISLDLLPTFLAMAGGAPDRKLDGVNLTPYMLDPTLEFPKRDIYWRWFNNWAVRRNNWKLVIVNHTQRYLYDLANDPSETTNIIDKKPDVYKSLLGSLKHWNNQLQPASWRFPEQVRILSKPLE